MAPFRNTKKLQNYACSSNHLLELEKPSDVQGEGGDCHTPLRFSWVFFEDDKTSAPDISVAVRYLSRAFWDKFSDGQFLWFRDMQS